MSYKSGEADLLTLIRTLGDWDANNSVSVANDTDKTSATLINNGLDYKYLFLSPGRFQSAYANISDVYAITAWETVITLVVYDRPGGPAPESDLVTLRQTVMDLLDGYYQGDSSTVSIAKVTSGEEIDTWKSRTDGQIFLTASFTLLWEEERSFTQND